MERITIYLLVFLVGIILGGMGSMSFLSNRWSARQVEYAPAVYTGYPMRGISWSSIIFALALGLAVLFIVMAQTRPGSSYSSPARELQQRDNNLSPALFEISK